MIWVTVLVTETIIP